MIPGGWEGKGREGLRFCTSNMCSVNNCYSSMGQTSNSNRLGSLIAFCSLISRACLRCFRPPSPLEMWD